MSVWDKLSLTFHSFFLVYLFTVFVRVCLGVWLRLCLGVCLCLCSFVCVICVCVCVCVCVDFFTRLCTVCVIVWLCVFMFGCVIEVTCLCLGVRLRACVCVYLCVWFLFSFVVFDVVVLCFLFCLVDYYYSWIITIYIPLRSIVYIRDNKPKIPQKTRAIVSPINTIKFSSKTTGRELRPRANDWHN